MSNAFSQARLIAHPSASGNGRLVGERAGNRRSEGREFSKAATCPAIYKLDDLQIRTDRVGLRRVAEAIGILQTTALMLQRVLPGLAIIHVKNNGTVIDDLGTVDLVGGKANIVGGSKGAGHG